MSSLYRATALVDWDTARRLVPVPKITTVRHLEIVFEQLQDRIARYISTIDADGYYRVNWRVYHGWHRGKTKTADRQIFEKYLASARSRTIRLVSFSTDLAFGDTLCCSSPRNPIFDTLRQDPDSGELRQKMVDTILVCDLLHLVRCRDSNLFMIVANDDDFVPALFTAESWRAKVVLLHNRSSMNSHLRLDGITSRMVGR